MQTAIKIEKRDVYGVPKYYPRNEQAENLARLIGTKTLTARAINQARAMGFEIFAADGFGNEVAISFDLREG